MVQRYSTRARWMAVGVAAVVATGTVLIAHQAGTGIPEIPPPKDEPRVVTPSLNGAAPSDAIVLFDGKDLSKWESAKGGEAKWKVDNGYLEVVPGAGDIQTKEKFGDVQLHIVWAAPAKIEGEGQGRGNSGIFLQNRYELQVLDSYQNKTYFHGQAGSIYKQWAPLVNASRKPGEWQSYDVVFHAPRFGADGKVTKPGFETVFQNGVLIQDHSEILGTTTHQGGPKYEAHGDDVLRLQDHHNLVRYRDIWIRKLEPRKET
jgi:hypothetical protein